MIREELKEAAKVMEAYANGKKIQCNYNIQDNEGWVDTDNPSFNWDKYVYRIKPEPEYRPFKSQEECWSEMLKHQPFGWVFEAITNHYKNIATVRDYDLILCGSAGFSTDFNIMFRDLKFADGTPFGIKEE